MPNKHYCQGTDCHTKTTQDRFNNHYSEEKFLNHWKDVMISLGVE